MARNRALENENIKKLYENLGLESLYEKQYPDTKYCIFISHKHEDKKAAEVIADFIMNKANIDVYLDNRDNGLQQAVKEGNDKKIVECIERGIARSTHILCLVSDYTKNSWWVPYEIGYSKKAKVSINSLILKNTNDIPSFLKIEKIYPGFKSLYSFLKEISTKLEKDFYEIDCFIKYRIEEYLEWYK